MTVMELIDLLSEYDPDAEVRLMGQPSWPFEYSVQAHLYFPPYGDTEDDFTPHDAPEAGVVYIVEGTQLAYGTKDAWS